MGYRVGLGYDVHPFAEGRRLVLGGVEIAWPRGLLGHSDADAVSHAIADALLGAMALGDLGKHFPDNDPAWEGANSLDILQRVVDKVAAAGARPINVDVTVIADEPRLAPHIEEMRERLASVLGIGAGAVSVKATRTEGMSTLSVGEGMAAHAILLVETDA